METYFCSLNSNKKFNVLISYGIIIWIKIYYTNLTETTEKDIDIDKSCEAKHSA